MGWTSWALHQTRRTELQMKSGRSSWIGCGGSPHERQGQAGVEMADQQKPLPLSEMTAPRRNHESRKYYCQVLRTLCISSTNRKYIIVYSLPFTCQASPSSPSPRSIIHTKNAPGFRASSVTFMHLHNVQQSSKTVAFHPPCSHTPQNFLPPNTYRYLSCHKPKTLPYSHSNPSHH